MLSSWIIRTLTLPPLLASLVPRNSRRCKTPTIYLPQNSHHTYLLWHFHSHSEIYCHATSTVPLFMTCAIIVILPLHDRKRASEMFLNVIRYARLLHIPIHCRRHFHIESSLF